MMGWLQNLFGTKTCETPPPPPPADNGEGKTPTTVVQVIVEETIMAVAQWLIALVNQTIQSRPPVPPPSEGPPVVNQTTAVEDLLLKFGTLIEQLHQRDQGTTLLENRIQAIETFLKQGGGFDRHVKDTHQAIAFLDQRLTRLEHSMGQIDVTAIESAFKKEAQLEQGIAESSQSIADLSDRLTHLEDRVQHDEPFVERLEAVNQTLLNVKQRTEHVEKLLARFRIVPRIVEGNSRAIVALQSHLETLHQRNGSSKPSHAEDNSAINVS